MILLDNTIDIWTRLADAGLVFLLMGIALIWLVRYLKLKDEIIKEKDANIAEKNKYIRENDAKNLEVLSKVNNAMDKMIETQKALNEKSIESQRVGTKSVMKELETLKEALALMIKNLSDKI